MPAKKITTPAKKTAAKSTAKKAAAKKAIAEPTAEPVKAAKVAKAPKAKPATSTEETSGPPEGLRLAQVCAQYAAEKKATDITILDMRKISSIADYTVVCTGTSLPHLRAIRKDIVGRVWDDHHVKVLRIDGNPESLWMVADFADVMIHIFHADTREKYSLEQLWSDAPRVPFSEKR